MEKSKMQPIPARLASERSVGATQAPSQFAALYMASGTGFVLTQAESTHLYMAAEKVAAEPWC